MATPVHGPDPVDGLRLAMMQRREAQLVARLKFRSFGVMDALQLALLIIGIVLLANAGHGRTRLNFLVLGWAMVIQGIGLWWAARSMARGELQKLQEKMSAVVQGRDGKVIAEAAISAQSLLLRKK